MNLTTRARFRYHLALWLVFFSPAFVQSVAAQSDADWLDRPLRNWNATGGAVVPRAPRAEEDPPIDARCRESIRNPQTPADRALVRAGWMLYGATQTLDSVSVITALSSFDGMCRPTGYQAFVFDGARFAGTLSPVNMDSRTDGSLTRIFLTADSSISAEFNRYREQDALCCPSRTSTVSYRLNRRRARRIVVPSGVDTVRNPQPEDSAPPQRQSIVSGTVTYLQRIALPVSAVVSVRLVDVSRQDARAVVIAEQEITMSGRQVPVPFEISYDSSQINARNRYAIQASITVGGVLRFRNTRAYPVVTGGNPSQLEIVLDAVGGTTTGTTATARGRRNVRGRASVPVGRSFNLAQDGRGRFDLAGRQRASVRRITVSVRINGEAEIVLQLPGNRSIRFGGRLEQTGANSLRIRLTNSGDADATGTAEVTYGERGSINAFYMSGTLDGQGFDAEFAS